MYVNIAVVNNSGNVGKSTLCNILLHPRLEGSQVIRVESINFDGSNEGKFSADQFEEIISKMDEDDCSIIDVGSSNIENFLLKMNEFKSSHEDIDYFIIPVTPSNKQQIDSIQTIKKLITLGIEPERIKVVFNMANKKLSIEKEFAEFLNDLPHDIKIGNYPIIYQSSVFDLLTKVERSFINVLNDKRDFRTLIRQSQSKEERNVLSLERSAYRLVNGFNEELDAAFHALNLTVTE